ncbi:MAG: hypothetical protein ACQESK_06700 [Bacteroidota bacterium]
MDVKELFKISLGSFGELSPESRPFIPDFKRESKLMKKAKLKTKGKISL